MKTSVSYLLLTLALTLFLSITVVVRADDRYADIDWNTIDWETFDSTTFDWASVDFAAFRQWLHHEASLSQLLQCYGKLPENVSEGHTNKLGQMFLSDPTGFVRAAAKESTRVQMLVAERLPVSMHSEMVQDGRTQFPGAVYSIKLTESDPAAAYYILDCFYAALEEYWGLDNPKTGDPVGIYAGLLLFSAFGIGWMLSRRKLA
ncbi:MAG: hypothetical protein IKC09_01155 [Oscillospiraceae bacterium]|nr:hypothetical protein [Oscillospiraceae bacterium]